jgi:hypothetical protein
MKRRRVPVAAELRSYLRYGWIAAEQDGANKRPICAIPAAPNGLAYPHEAEIRYSPTT